MPIKSIADRLVEAKTESHIMETMPNFNGTFTHILNIRDFLDKYPNWTNKYSSEHENYEIRNGIVIFLSTLIICVSLFGNLILCKIVFCTSNFRSMTNIFIGSLSISDLIMTVFNLPAQIIKIIDKDWPFGAVFCKCSPFLQALSVTVSSFTMAYIALDRYHVIAHPLKAKAELKIVLLKLTTIWTMAMIVALPYFFLSKLEVMDSRGKILRCNVIYPEPEMQFRRIFSFLSLFVQFIIPLMISCVAYIWICSIIWQRKCIGSVTNDQIARLRKSKWKTIKTLIVVLVVFTLCWLPINVYHIYQDMSEIEHAEKHKPNVYLACHLIAMSSVCYNPFIYFWLNDKFKKKVKSNLLWICNFKKSRVASRESAKLSNRLFRHLSVYRNSSGLSKTTNCSIKSREKRLNIDDTQTNLLPYKTLAQRNEHNDPLTTHIKHEPDVDKTKKFQKEFEQQNIKNKFLVEYRNGTFTSSKQETLV